MPSFHSVLAAALLAACAMPAAARDTKLVLPVDKVLQHPDTQKALNNMPMRFGAASAGERAPAAPGGELSARSWGRPQSYSSLYREGIVRRLNDEETCMLALRHTLANLAAEARSRGATAVVDIVSNYGGVEMNSATQYECHAGDSSSVVTLKGRASN